MTNDTRKSDGLKPGTTLRAASLNMNLELYSKAMQEVAGKRGVVFAVVYQPTSTLFQSATRTNKYGNYLYFVKKNSCVPTPFVAHLAAEFHCVLSASSEWHERNAQNLNPRIQINRCLSAFLKMTAGS